MPNNSNAYIRLMDLLAGWSSYTYGNIEMDDAELSDINMSRISIEQDADAIQDLYQEVGKIDDMTGEQVKEFIKTRVIPLVLRGVS